MTIAQNLENEQLLCYYKNTTKSRYFYNVKKYDSCIFYIRKAFINKDVIHLFQDEFCLSLAYSHIGNKDSSFYYLMSSIQKSPSLLFFTEYIQMDTDEFNIKGIEYKFIDLNKDYYSKLNNLYLNKKNMYRIKNSFNIIRDSSRYFFINDMYYSETNRKSKFLEIYKEIIDTTILNRVRFEEKLVEFIIRNNTIISVNNYGIENFFPCIIHMSTINLKKILPITFNDFKSQNISPYVYGAIIERIRKNENLDKCAGYNIMHSSYCDESNWDEIINNRNLIGANNYLTEDDYSLNAFSKIYRNRIIQPWIEKLLNE